MQAISSKDLDARFKFDVAARPGAENLTLCFACGTCTAACPVSEIDAEFSPRKIIRQVLLGMREQVLASPVIWRCVQCYACYAKCPQNVKFRDVLKALREMAVDEGYVDPAVSAEIARLDELSQKLRRSLAETLFTDRARYDAIKAEVEKALSR